jgi:hypothetical protein
MKSFLFWDITPCFPLKATRRFWGIFRPHIKGGRINQGRNGSACYLLHAGFLLGLFIVPDMEMTRYFRKLKILHVSSSSICATVRDEPWPFSRLIAIGPDNVTFRLQFLMLIVSESSSTESSHYIAGLLTRRVPSGLRRVHSCKDSVPAF